MSAGCRLLQIRAKRLGGAAFLELAEAVVADARPAGARVIVNDRVDIARLSGADGVHVGQDDLEVTDVRRLLGPDAIVGLSTHTAEQIAMAIEQPISYLAIGPVFGTATKDTGYEPVGLDMVRRAVQQAGARGIPVVGIGGITRERAREVWAAGAASVAVITDLIAGDPAEAAGAWRRLAGEFDRDA